MSNAATDIQLDALLTQDPSFLVQQQRSRFEHVLELFGESFVLFGAGALGRAALLSLRKAGIEPRAFADNNPQLWNKIVDGVPVLSPTEAAEQFGHNTLFVATVYTSEPVRHQLRKLGVNSTSFAALAWNYPQAFLPHCALDLPHQIFKQADAVRAAATLWADESSHREYLGQLRWRTSLDPDSLPPHDAPADTYFPRDLVPLSPKEVFVDCGAYDGATIRSFVERGGASFRQIVGLEPDPHNFTLLQETVAALPDEVKQRCRLWPLAAGARREKLQFNATGTVCSTVGIGDTEVDCAPLDEILADCAPTYIKFDVEGAELDALEGCRNVIRAARPVLAVCLYHRQDHLWRVPALLRAQSSKYRFFLRRYSDECWELVCYAIPLERLLR